MNHLKANILGLALLCCLPMGAQLKWNQAYQTYINQYKDLAIEQMLRYRIPASITLAQGLFESAAGRSDLVRQGNNHFGIKCHNWTDPPSTTTMMPGANASAYTRTQETATKTTASFWRASHATHASSNSRSTTTRDGLAD